MMAENEDKLIGKEQPATAGAGDEGDNDNAPHLSPGDLELSRYSSIAMINYFNCIEQICEEKGFSPENVEQFFRVHWLRGKVGGSFARAQEMYGKYVDYINNVPEEARTLEIPEQIKIALCDLTSFITWYYRMSYTQIQSDGVKKAEAVSSRLQEQVTELLERLSKSADEVTELTRNNHSLTNQLEHQKDITGKLEVALADTRNELKALSSDLEHARSENRLLEQSTKALDQQLNERRQEMADQLKYQKQLVKENKAQQAELSGLARQCDTLKQTVSGLKSSSSETEQDLAATLKHSSALKDRLAECEDELAATRAELEKEEGETERLAAEVKRLKEENQQLLAQRSEQTTEILNLRNQALSMEATLNAEKTISAVTQ
ncbi:TPA: hypothetical protein ACP61A_004622, partial [Escherichia coli]